MLPEGIFLGGRSSLYLTNDAPQVFGRVFFTRYFSGMKVNFPMTVKPFSLRIAMALSWITWSMIKTDCGQQMDFQGMVSFKLIRPGLDNHFPESWEVKEVGQLVSAPQDQIPVGLELYPNPTRDMITITVHGS